MRNEFASREKGTLLAIIIMMKNMGRIIKGGGALKEWCFSLSKRRTQFLIGSNRVLGENRFWALFSLLSAPPFGVSSAAGRGPGGGGRSRRRDRGHSWRQRKRKQSLLRVQGSGIILKQDEEEEEGRGRGNCRFSAGKGMAAELEAGFAKLQGEDFEYYMQTYSIVLGRNSKKSTVDVDLAGLGGGMNISRQHARIFYDFDKKRFALEVLGKNGCHVQGALYHPGDPPVKLHSQYLLQIGDKKFYFLLPVRSILRPSVTPTPSLPPLPVPIPAPTPLVMPTIAPSPIPLPMTTSIPHHLSLPPHVQGPTAARKRPSSKLASSVPMTGPVGIGPPMIMKTEDLLQNPIMKKPRGHKKHDAVDIKPSLSWLPPHDTSSYMMANNHARPNMIFNPDFKADVRRQAEGGGEALPMQAEEKEVVSAVATVLSDLCGPGEWMPLPNLHSELVEHYSGIWPHARVRKFLTADDVEGDNKGRPWVGLLALLRKYPEHFVINTRTKGRVTSEFVSLVSLLS